MVVSAYIIAGLAGWAVAQGVKFALNYRPSRSKQKNLRGLYVSGGMPSAHTSTIVALTTVIGLIDGFDSGLFGLAAVITAVVMYDAVMVRRSSGVQGEVLSRLVKDLGKDIKLPFFAKGHSPVEVLVGAAIGLLVGYVVFFATI